MMKCRDADSPCTGVLEQPQRLMGSTSPRRDGKAPRLLKNGGREIRARRERWVAGEYRR